MLAQETIPIMAIERANASELGHRRLVPEWPVTGSF